MPLDTAPSGNKTEYCRDYPRGVPVAVTKARTSGLATRSSRPPTVMPPLVQLQVPLAAAAGVLLLVLVAEAFHERRCRSCGPARPPDPRAGRGVGSLRSRRQGRVARRDGLGADHARLRRRRAPRRGEPRQPARTSAAHCLRGRSLAQHAPARRRPPADMTRAQRMYDVVDAVLRRVNSDMVKRGLLLHRRHAHDRQRRQLPSWCATSSTGCRYGTPCSRARPT